MSLNLLEQLLRQRQREQQQVQDELDDAETEGDHKNARRLASQLSSIQVLTYEPFSTRLCFLHNCTVTWPAGNCQGAGGPNPGRMMMARRCVAPSHRAFPLQGWSLTETQPRPRPRERESPKHTRATPVARRRKSLPVEEDPISVANIDYEEEALRIQDEAEARFARVQANFNGRGCTRHYRASTPSTARLR